MELVGHYRVAETVAAFTPGTIWFELLAISRSFARRKLLAFVDAQVRLSGI